jgi:hypothetical protein
MTDAVIAQLLSPCSESELTPDRAYDINMAALKQRAKLYVEDNIRFPTVHDYLMIESAMMIGALIALGRDTSVSAGETALVQPEKKRSRRLPEPV